jgi:hypothetical protein
MFDTIFGLPVHALVVHAVVVLVPLCSVGVIICALSGTWYDRLATPVIVLLTLSVPSAFVARMSGHDLEDRLPASDAIEHHADLGSLAAWVVLLFWIIAVAWYFVERRRGRQSGLTKALMVISVIAAIGATGYIVIVGDSGARAAWEDVITSTNP